MSRLPLLSSRRRRYQRSGASSAVVDLVGPNFLPSGSTFTRASTGWMFNSAGLLTPKSDDIPRYDHGPDGVFKGLLLEMARTNQFVNADAPVTQTSPSLATGTYRLWMDGAGSVAVAANTATITGAGTATDGSPVEFVVTGAGTVDFTVTGTPDRVQCELGAFPTSPIISGGSPTSRAADFLSTPFPFSWAEIYAAGGLSFRVEFVEGGTFSANNQMLVTVGGAFIARGFYIYRPGDSRVRTNIHNGTTAVGLDITSTVPTIGDHVVIIARIETRDNSGTPEARLASVRQWINGVESGSNTTPSAWLDITANLASGWSGSQTAYINSRDGGNNRGRAHFQSVRVALAPYEFSL